MLLPTPLRSIEPAIANDRGILPADWQRSVARPGDPPTHPWMITDRGQTPRKRVKGRPALPQPDFAAICDSHCLAVTGVYQRPAQPAWARR
jgi:hypothetical protein